MIEDETPRDERFWTPRTFRSASSKSDHSSEGDWSTPRTASVRLERRRSETSESEYETPALLTLLAMQGKTSDCIHMYASTYWSRRTMSYNYPPQVDPNQYWNRAEEKLSHHSGSLGYNSTPLTRHQEEFDVGAGNEFTVEDIEDIFSFARHGRCDDIENLLHQGMPINVRDEFGSTLLTIACQNGNKRVAKVILRHGGDINCRNHKGNTPLHYCCQYGYYETLGQYLISKGADPTIRNNAGKLCWDGI